MAIVRIGTDSAGSANQNSVATSGFDTTGANFIVLGLTSYAGNPSPLPTDFYSNVWTALTNHFTSNGARTQLFYCANPTVGTGHTFSASQGGSFPAIVAFAYSGVDTSPFDAENGNASSNATSLQPGLVTPAGNNELFITLVGHDSAGTDAVDSGFSTPVTVAFLNNEHYGTAMSDLIQSTAAGENPTWSGWSSTDCAASIAVFKGPNIISDSITLGLTQGIAFAGGVAVDGAITLALDAGISFPNNIGAHGTIALGVTCGITPAATSALHGAITLGLTQGLTLASNANQTVGITIALGGLDLSFRRFVDAELTIGLELGWNDLDDGLAGATPGTFRPDGPSGPAGIFRAIDVGDVTPGIFKAAVDVGTPGRFKPTE